MSGIEGLCRSSPSLTLSVETEGPDAALRRTVRPVSTKSDGETLQPLDLLRIIEIRNGELEEAAEEEVAFFIS